MRLTIFCIFFLLSLAVGAAPVLIVLAVVYAVACWQAKASPDIPPPDEREDAPTPPPPSSPYRRKTTPRSPRSKPPHNRRLNLTHYE